MGVSTERHADGEVKLPHSTDDHPSHHRSTVAEGPVCRVDHCACGMFHVAIGPMTLRFDPAAAESLVATLAQALRARPTDAAPRPITTPSPTTFTDKN